MSKKLEEAMAILSELSLDERGQLAAKILLSLEESSEEEIEKLWIAEAECRLQEYREGKVRGIPAEEVFQRAIKDIS
jgi:putative addiction module component (TIGR02574 family)